MSKIFDISVPVSPESVVWPGAPKTNYEWRRSMCCGDVSNNANLSINAHTGTHVDAPLHFVDGGDDVASIPLDVLCGEVFVMDLSDCNDILLADLNERWPANKNVKRLILKTKNSGLWEDPNHEFKTDFLALREPETRFLLEKNIQLVGIDYLSIQPYKTDPIVHQLLLNKKVVIIEGLDLRQILSGWYDLTCLPLKMRGLDGCPARAILKSIS